MARASGSTANRIKKWIKEGRGQGNGPNYKPWLTVRDVPSKGTSSRIMGWKSQRVHHFLSQSLEESYFYLLDWSPVVIDIREQYPLLPLEETLEISEELGLKHPVNVKTKEPEVITTDFMITVEDKDGVSLVARTLKKFTDINETMNLRLYEKFLIEEVFYKRRNIRWGIVTEIDMPKDLVQNIKFLHYALTLEGYPDVSSSEVLFIAPELFKALNNDERSCSNVALEFDKKLGKKPGTCLFIIQHMLATKKWFIDMNKRINPSEHIKFFKQEQKYAILGGLKYA